MSGPQAGQRFVEYLQSLADKEERAPLAALRRGLGKRPGEASEMYPYVVPFLPPNLHPEAEDPYYLVAALFALHQGSWSRQAPGAPTNLGASLQRLAAASESGGVEARVVALLNAHPDDMPEHLRRIVALLKAHDVPIDWARLLHDIQHWGHPDRFVQRQWARAFWAGAATQPQETPQPTTVDVPE